MDLITTWHWPDHAIGKRESRQLREGHNATANIAAELLEALRLCTDALRNHLQYNEGEGSLERNAYDAARAAIAKATT